MALIKCPECGKEISDKAEMCINCGFPLKQHENNEMSAGKSEFYKSYEQENENDTGWERPKEPEITGVGKLFLRNSVERSQNTGFNGIYKYTLFGEKKRGLLSKMWERKLFSLYGAEICTRQNKDKIHCKSKSI